MEWEHGVTALYPQLATHQAPAPSSSTPETPWRIIQEAGATEKHTRVVNPTLIAHFNTVLNSLTQILVKNPWSSPLNGILEK